MVYSINQQKCVCHVVVHAKVTLDKSLKLVWQHKMEAVYTDPLELATMNTKD